MKSIFNHIFGDPIWSNDNFELLLNLQGDPSSSFGYRWKTVRGDSGDSLHFYMDLPGVKKEDVVLEFFDRKLKVSALRKDQGEEKFNRTFILPDDTDSDKIQAKLENGVLDVELPKIKTKDPKTRQIKIG